MIEKNRCYQSKDLNLIEIGNINNFQQTLHKNVLITDLESQIMRIVTQQEQRQFQNAPLIACLTQDLELIITSLQENINTKTTQQVVQIRMHQLAIAKILVFTHGKSDFRLVQAHFALGRAYLENGCYDQAVNHLTISSTKVTKMGDVKETKVYNSYILTALARCYLALGGHLHALELLSRAYDIQSNNQNIKGSSLAQETLQLLASIHIRLKSPKEAVKVLDKLIDIINTQFQDFDSLYTKLLDLADKLIYMDSKNEVLIQTKIQSLRKKGSEYIQLLKPFQILAQKLQFLIVEFDRRTLRELLPQILNQLEILVKNPSIFTSVLTSLRSITGKLVQQLKKQRIFKFKIFLDGQGEYLTHSIDTQLKSFLKQYDEQPDHDLKRLDENQRIQVYKLLVHYCVRFSDHDTQLQYLDKLHQMFESKALTSFHSKQELLKVKRNIAMIYNQKRNEQQTLTILTEIKKIEKELYGANSEAVRKTVNMMRIIDSGVVVDPKPKSKRTVALKGERIANRQPTRKLLL